MDKPNFIKPANFKEMTEEQQKELIKKQRRDYAYWRRNNDPEYHEKQLQITRDYKKRMKDQDKEEFTRKANLSSLKCRNKKEREYNAMKDILTKLKISINDIV